MLDQQTGTQTITSDGLRYFSVNKISLVTGYAYEGSNLITHLFAESTIRLENNFQSGKAVSNWEQKKKGE